jgi:hypothetical protein
MAQDGITAGGASYTLDNVTFPVGRTKLQSIFDAIRSTNKGNTAPDLVAGQFWIDDNTPSTTVWTLYFYDGTDSIQFATIDTINNTVNFIDSTFTQLTSDLATNGNDINFGDNDKAQFGDSNDLQIYHNGSNSYIQDNGTGNLSIDATQLQFRNGAQSQTYADFANGGAARLFYGGAVKISTTTSGVSVTGTVVSDGLTVDNGASQTDIQIESDVASNIKMSVSSTDYFRIYTSPSDTQIRNLTANPMIFNTTDTERMRIDGSGHIGVGTSTLPRTLNIYGASNGTIGLDNPVSGSPQIAFKQNGTDKAFVTYWDAFDTLALSDGSGNGLHFKPSTGNVGIGTSSPATTLVVHGTANSTVAYIGGDSDNAPNRKLAITGSGNDLTYTIDSTGASSLFGQLAFATNGTEAMRIDSSGRVMVGTTSASNLNTFGDDLIVSNTSGGTGSGISIISNATNGYSNVYFGDTDDADIGRIQYNNLDNSMTFRTNASDAMRIDSSGNVLVGKTAIALATVGGELRADGQITGTRNGGSPLILNRTTSDGEIAQFYKDATKVGSIGTYAGDMIIGTTDTGLRFDDGASAYIPWNTSTNLATDGTISLGFSTVKYNNLYLSGSVYLGGTGSANALDDYEEGSWTPSLGGTTTNPTTSYNHQVGRYTKIGRTVTIDFYIQLNTSGNSGGTGDLTINGFPFNVGSLNTHGKSGLCMYTAGFSTAGNGAPIGFYAVNNSTFAYFRSPASSYPSTSFHTGTQASDIGNSVIVAGTLTYQIT